MSDDDEEARGSEYACGGDSDVYDGILETSDLVQKEDDVDFA